MNRILLGFCVLSIAVSGFAFYFIQRDDHRVKLPEVPKAKQNNVESENSPGALDVEQDRTTSEAKDCACCSEKLARARKMAKERMQARETWGRKVIADYGYEEGMKRIAAKSPWLVARIKQSLIENRTPLGDKQHHAGQRNDQ